MERRDLLKDQIEQLGKVLAKILSDFIGFKSKGAIESGIETSLQQLKNDVNVDIYEVINYSGDDLRDYFRHRDLHAPHLDTIARFMVEFGKTCADKDKANLYYQKALESLDIADEFSRTFSIERAHLQTEIKDLVK